MAYKLKSSGLPFKELGSSPAKQTKKTKRKERKRVKKETVGGKSMPKPRVNAEGKPRGPKLSDAEIAKIKSSDVYKEFDKAGN